MSRLHPHENAASRESCLSHACRDCNGSLIFAHVHAVARASMLFHERLPSCHLTRGMKRQEGASYVDTIHSSLVDPFHCRALSRSIFSRIQSLSLMSHPIIDTRLGAAGTGSVSSCFGLRPCMAQESAKRLKGALTRIWNAPTKERHGFDVRSSTAFSLQGPGTKSQPRYGLHLWCPLLTC